MYFNEIDNKKLRVHIRLSLNCQYKQTNALLEMNKNYQVRS